MTNLNPFKKEIKETYHLPDTNPAFFDRLEVKLQTHQPDPGPKTTLPFKFKRGWAYALVAILIIGAMVLIVGPSQVLAQIQAVFGYVPGIGLVDSNSSFKQLAETISETRDGITLTVKSAFLSADQTTIVYEVSKLPPEIEPDNFGDPECLSPPYLSLPDGSKIEASRSGGELALDGAFVNDIRFNSPIPADVNQATLVFPCLEGTAQGLGPQNWQIALTFKPAPEDVIVYPATIVPTQIKSENAVQPETGVAEASMPAIIVDGDRQEEMVVLSVVEKPESFWVTWGFPSAYDADISMNGFLYMKPFNPVLYDANGEELPPPNPSLQDDFGDLEDSLREQLPDEDQIKYVGSMYTYAIPKSGVEFPVYIKLNVLERSFSDKESFADIEFNGSLIQSEGDRVSINQEIQIGDIKFDLKSIDASRLMSGFVFHFDGTKGKVIQCKVEILGYPTNISGNGHSISGDRFLFNQSVMYHDSAPTGLLTARISQPAVVGDTISFIGSWSPGQ